MKSTQFILMAACILLLNISYINANNKNDGAFITRSEFETLQDTKADSIEVLQTNLDKIISEVMSYLESGTPGEMLDIIYPVGTTIICNKAPECGTWIMKNTDPDGYALYGTVVEDNILQIGVEEASFFKLELANTKMANHTVKLVNGETDDAGEHKHTFTDHIENEIKPYGSKTGQSGSKYVYMAKRDGIWSGNTSHLSTTPSGTHKHSLAGNIESKEQSHRHTIQVEEDNVYKKEARLIRPDSFVVQMWTRIA